MIDRNDIERLKEIFVTRKECDEVQDGVQRRLEKDGNKLSVIEAKLSMVLWVLAAVGSGVIAMLVKLFFGE